MKKIVFLLLFYPFLIIAPAERLDFEKFDQEDKARTAKRMAQEKAREEYLAKEDQARAKRRDDLTTSKMIIEQGSTGHSVSDRETQEARNEVILANTKEYLAEDFEIRKQRFDEFKQKYPDFSQNPKWSKLLELSDMNEFLNKTYNGRKQFLEEINAIINDPELTADIEQHENALQDLLQLTLFHHMKTNPLDQKTTDDIKNDISSIKENIGDILKNVFNDYTTRLNAFNEALHNLPEINTLNMLQKIENASNQASIALGFAALFAMVAGPAHLAVLGVTITVEKFAFFAKAALVTGHVAGAKAEDLKIDIQNKITEQIEAITNTALPKAGFFKNTGDSLGKRFKRWLTEKDTAYSNQDSWKGKAYRGLKNLSGIGVDGIKSATEWLKTKKDSSVDWWNKKETESNAFKVTGDTTRAIGKRLINEAKAIPSKIVSGYKAIHFEYHNLTKYRNLSRKEAQKAYEKQQQKDKREEYNKTLAKFLPLNINLEEGNENSNSSVSTTNS